MTPLEPLELTQLDKWTREGLVNPLTAGAAYIRVFIIY